MLSLPAFPMRRMQSRPWASGLATIQPFRVMALPGRAKAMEAEGRDIIHLEVGEPDFPAPSPVAGAGQTVLSGGAPTRRSRV